MLDSALLQRTLEPITRLRTQLLEAREGLDPEHPRYQSLLNLRQYLLLRSQDRTELQEQLFLMSLSSLGRSYAHVAASIDTLYDQLCSALGLPLISKEEMASFHHVSITEAIATASRNSAELFGIKAGMRLSHQHTAIMVTLPSYAAEHEGALIHNLAKAGVNVFRINTAHDSPEIWRAMAKVIRSLNEERPADMRLKIFVDLAGPKIRTAKIRRLELPVVVGSNKREKRVRIYPEHVMTSSEKQDPITLETITAQICSERLFFDALQADERIKVIDANGKVAHITLFMKSELYAEGSIDKKVYLDSSALLKCRGKRCRVHTPELQIETIRLNRGDTLLLGESDLLGHGAKRDASGAVLELSAISCSYKGLSDFVSLGDAVFIDDGKIGLKVREKSDAGLLCEVTQCKTGGAVLKEEKGINFPDSPLAIPALTENDRANLLATIDFADSYSISFCQSAEDVRSLRALLLANGRDDIGIVAKIETRRAVAQMPQILEALLTCKHSGVMIARGDLAIEVGFRHLAIIQEKLIDICDAAHMPVIWATQVLESQMKTNLPSRAEVTDAAMAGRAECVMLNKGPFAIDTIEALISILHDMHQMFKKNRQLLNKETLW